MICTDTYRPSHVHQTGTDCCTTIPCVREVDDQGRHRGSHQGWEPMPGGQNDHEKWGTWERLWTWEAGGAAGSSRKGPGYTCMSCRPDSHRHTHEPEDHGLITCPACGILHDPWGHMRDGYPEGTETWCFGCALWEDRALAHARNAPLEDTRRGMRGRWSRTVRPHNDSLASGERPRLYGWSHGHHGAFGGRLFVVTWDDGQEAGPDDCLWDSGAIPWWLLDRFPPNATVVPHRKEPRAGHTNSLGHPLTYTGHPGDL